MWNISRPVYKFHGPEAHHIVALTGGESKDKPPEKLSPEEIREALKQLRDDIPTVERYRLEALENFKKKILENRHDFEGSDSNQNETLTNKVFQYAYAKLDEFFKKRFNPNWPIKIYKNWMNAACDTMASDILNSAPIDPFALLLQTDKSRIDEMLGYTYDFETFFAMNEPQLFEEWKKQYPEEIYTVLPRLGDNTSAVTLDSVGALGDFRRRVWENRHILTKDVYIHAYTKLEYLFKERLDPNWPIEIYKNWMNYVCNAAVDEIEKRKATGEPIGESAIDQILQGIEPFETYFVRTAPKVFEQYQEESRKELKRLGDDMPAFERNRLEALGNFKKTVLENYHDFEGNDENPNETLTNPVFQYAYSELEEFFKKDLNRDWPIKFYQDWMNAVCDVMAHKIAKKSFEGKRITPSTIDGIFWGVDTFETYFTRTAPKVFEKWKAQYSVKPQNQNPQQKQNG